MQNSEIKPTTASLSLPSSSMKVILLNTGTPKNFIDVSYASEYQGKYHFFTNWYIYVILFPLSLALSSYQTRIHIILACSCYCML